MTSSSKPRPNFVIVEGSSTNAFDDIYEDFKKDFLDEDVLVKDMCEKYGLSSYQYNTLRKRVAEETGVNRKISKYSVGTSWIHDKKFIDKQKGSGKYRVSKVINGKYFHFGVYDDLETAMMVRDEMMSHDWNQDYYIQLKYDLFGESDKDTQKKIQTIYEDYKKDFLRGESNKYLMRKYDVGLHISKVISKMIRSETGLKRKPQLPIKVRKEHEREINA